VRVGRRGPVRCAIVVHDLLPMPPALSAGEGKKFGRNVASLKVRGNVGVVAAEIARSLVPSSIRVVHLNSNITVSRTQC
jgi:hypothetical protein